MAVASGRRRRERDAGQQSRTDYCRAVPGTVVVSLQQMRVLRRALALPLSRARLCVCLLAVHTDTYCTVHT